MPEEKKQPYTEKVQAVIDAQIVTSDGLTGELLYTYAESPYLFIVFKDGRWAAYTMVRGAGGTEIHLHRATPDLSYLYAAGLLTEQDRTEQQSHETSEAEKELEKQELAELDRLLAKYGDRRGGEVGEVIVR